MKNIGFKVFINSKASTIAGTNTSSSLGLHLMLRRDLERNEQLISLDLGAYSREDDMMHTWIKEDLQVNDEIHVKIVCDQKYDAPSESKPYHTPDMDDFVLKSKLNTYYKLKEELKDHLES